MWLSVSPQCNICACNSFLQDTRRLPRSVIRPLIASRRSGRLVILFAEPQGAFRPSDQTLKDFWLSVVSTYTKMPSKTPVAPPSLRDASATAPG